MHSLLSLRFLLNLNMVWSVNTVALFWLPLPSVVGVLGANPLRNALQRVNDVIYYALSQIHITCIECGEERSLRIGLLAFGSFSRSVSIFLVQWTFAGDLVLSQLCDTLQEKKCHFRAAEIAFSGNGFVKCFSSIAIYLCWLENNLIVWWWRWYNCAAIHASCI